MNGRALTFSRLPQLRLYSLLAVLAVLSSVFLARNVDLRVYWYGVTGFFSGTRPAYGPRSGIGFPMEYRYPPVTYLLLSPLRLFSLRVAGFLWMLAAWGSAAVAVSLAVRIRRFQFSHLALFACLAFLASDLVLAVRYGNVQPFVIAWLFAALVLSESRPICAGFLLSLAVTFKIWPLLFVPWLLRRARWRAAGAFAVSLSALWLAPILAFGAARYKQLLRDWFVAVARVGSTYSEFYYFPGQSLRGLLLRLLTPTAPPLAYFPDVHIFAFTPHLAVTLWMATGAVAYSLSVLLMLRSDAQKMVAWDGFIFVLYSMLEPYAVKSGLISLAPAVITAACLYTCGSQSRERSDGASIRWANRLFLAACVGSFAEAMIQYRPAQRWLLSVGLDFWVDLLLLAALLVWAERTAIPGELGMGMRRGGVNGHRNRN